MMSFLRKIIMWFRGLFRPAPSIMNQSLHSRELSAKPVFQSKAMRHYLNGLVIKNTLRK